MKEGKVGVTRYSDADLLEFNEILGKKLTQAIKELDFLQDQIMEFTENSDDDRGDWMDDSANGNEIEMLNTMSIRIRKHVRDLENALLRVRNKTYGICQITGELIDKKRLLAVPTATKSLEGKLAEKALEKPTTAKREVPPPPVRPKERQIISRVIKPAKPKSAAPIPDDDDDDLDLDDQDKWMDLDMEDSDEENDTDINPDELSEEDLA